MGREKKSAFKKEGEKIKEKKEVKRKKREGKEKRREKRKKKKEKRGEMSKKNLFICMKFFQSPPPILNFENGE